MVQWKEHGSRLRHPDNHPHILDEGFPWARDCTEHMTQSSILVGCPHPNVGDKPTKKNIDNVLSGRDKW